MDHEIAKRLLDEARIRTDVARSVLQTTKETIERSRKRLANEQLKERGSD